MPHVETGCLISHRLPTQICQQHTWWAEQPVHTLVLKKTAIGLCAKPQNLPSNDQVVRSDDSSASGSLNPFLIETVGWKRCSWQRRTKISQKPRYCSFPKLAELHFSLYWYRIYVCSCTCYILSTKLCILLTKWGHFLGSENILAGPHNFKNLFEGNDLVLNSGLELGLG